MRRMVSRLEALGWLMPEIWAHGELWHVQPDDMDVSDLRLSSIFHPCHLD